jgi:hypothetical protein
LSVGFQTNGKTREKNGGSEKGIKKAAGRRPGALWGDIGYLRTTYNIMRSVRINSQLAAMGWPARVFARALFHIDIGC